MQAINVGTLIAERALDPDQAALAWLLVEGGVPVVVIGPAPSEQRNAIARAIVSIDPRRPWVVLDADAEPPTLTRLGALLQGGTCLGIVLAAADLQDTMDRLSRPPSGLPEDAVRRLGMVMVADGAGDGGRCAIIHYLRPTERDGQGHIQRRPPAVLSAWDEATGIFEDYAWAVTPELADRVDRAQADFEDRWRDRARFLAEAVVAHDRPAHEQAGMIGRYLASEPPRTPASAHPAARPSPFHRGLTDPHDH
jgi:hypothetical protein